MNVRIDRVTTRGGDSGQTGLGDGSRVSKAAARVEAIGAVDEANAALGVLRASLPPGAAADAFLRTMQNRLFDLGADLCMPEAEAGSGAGAEAGPEAGGSGARRRYRLPELAPEIEAETEALRVRQAPLTSFVLPGGSMAAAQAHLARTIVRRAERRVVALSSREPVTPSILRLLNRLSDYLFVLSRHLNRDGADDVLWQKDRQPATGAGSEPSSA